MIFESFYVFIALFAAYFGHVKVDSSIEEEMLVFCPHCGAILAAQQREKCYAFCCPDCPYMQPITSKVSSRTYTKMKDIDEVLGGPGAWANAQACDERCPQCSHDRAYFMQLQTRSADEPMTTFYRCANCAHRWKE